MTDGQFKSVPPGLVEPIRSDTKSPVEFVVRQVSWPLARDLDDVLRREWLVTNGLGGYASGTVAGAITRRYHGLLIAALPAPLGRVMLLNHLSERIRFGDQRIAWLTPYGEGGHLVQEHGSTALVEFRLDMGIPTWRFELDQIAIERTIVMPNGQNTVHVTYRLVRGLDPVRLTLRPMLGFRGHDAPVNAAWPLAYTLTARDRRIDIHGDPTFPALRLALHAGLGAFIVEDQGVDDVRYLLEQSRGYDWHGSLWSPGYFRAELASNRPITFIASSESWETVAALNPDDALAGERRRLADLVHAAVPAAQSGLAAELVLAADQFIVRPAARVTDETAAQARGEHARTIIAGYHWFTDWGRDTMISLEGLTLLTGRHAEARQILRTFADHERDGLIPNLFPEGTNRGLYHTADATLWFFHALAQYEHYTGDRGLVDELLRKLVHIAECHFRGTKFGIRVAEDGLLQQGADGYQLTWMDAKVDDWVVTPRRGKAVEINALWYNALRLLESWLARAGDTKKASATADAAERHKATFNARFWNEATGHLFDLVDGESGDDPSCRPNQILAFSLLHPVLDSTRWRPVLDVVTRQLLTPYGLRSLAPADPRYKSTYYGDLRSRDAAYHQGTVWTWLFGPFIDAWLACRPDDLDGARQTLDALGPHLSDACIGSVSEIFDADAPFVPRGCIAQAWSVAECLRVLVRTAASAHNTAARQVAARPR
jgi:predicted glycogen debranching enzyme